MKLIMYLNNQLIDAVPLNLVEITWPGYIGRIKRDLETKHRELIRSSAKLPDYFVIDTSFVPNRTFISY
jgi:hypothetical protein